MTRFLSLIMLFLLTGSLATAQIRRPPTWPDIPLPGGPVRNVILDNCTACHGIDDYAFYALDRDGWNALIDDKHQGDHATELSANERTMLLDFLVSQFGPESIPFPRDYVPPEIDEFFTNADARIFIEVRCIACHTLDPVFNTRHNEEGWRVLLVNERERGAQLNDEELEKLTEWLGRARGVNLFE
jgi:mono/diheme cytochrome c family protein